MKGRSTWVMIGLILGLLAASLLFVDQKKLRQELDAGVTVWDVEKSETKAKPKGKKGRE